MASFCQTCQSNTRAGGLGMKNKIVALCGIMMFVLVFGVVAHAQGAKVAGTWVITNKGHNGVVTSTLTLTQDGITLKGTMKS
jgi:hypothetical protein